MMNAPEDDSRGNRGGAHGNYCANCGGALKMLVDIPPHGDLRGRNRPSTRYFRCERCRHIRIVDE